MKFIVSEEFFEKVPNAYFGIVYFNNFDNKTKLDFTDKMLEESIESAKEKLGEERVKENALIIPYREAFRNLGINPNKFMPLRNREKSEYGGSDRSNQNLPGIRKP